MVSKTSRIRRRGSSRSQPEASRGPTGSLSALGHNGVARMATTDVGAHQRRARSTRLQRSVDGAGAGRRAARAAGRLRPERDPSHPPLPRLAPTPVCRPWRSSPCWRWCMVVPLLGAGRSPHILYRPDELNMTFDDVRGSESLVEEVTKTLNLFLAHRTFAEQMGGSPRKAILFEGPPGTGQDLHGQGHGRRGRGAVPLRLLVRLPVDVLRPDQQEDPGLLQGVAPARPA